MIPVRNEDVVVARRTIGGRSVLFTSTDVRPGWPLPWWGVVADTGGDGFGLLVRLDEDSAPAGWTARQLLLVVRNRLAAEAARRALMATSDALAALDRAAACWWGMTLPGASPGSGVIFLAGGDASPYPWTVAACGEFALTLCSDPESRGEGVTPEQLLIVLDQLLLDAAKAKPQLRGLWDGHRHIATALAAEGQRLAAVRA